MENFCTRRFCALFLRENLGRKVLPFGKVGFFIKEEKLYDVLEWLPIKSFDEFIYLVNNDVISVFEVKPVNFKLKSELEQMAILDTYKRFLKQCDFDVQILVLAYKTDVSKHLEKVDKYLSEETNLKQMAICYKDLVEQIVSGKKSLVRRFFIAFKKKNGYEESVNKIFSTLDACGNEVIKCSNDDICKIFECFFRREKI